MATGERMLASSAGLALFGALLSVHGAAADDIIAEPQDRPTRHSYAHDDEFVNADIVTIQGERSTRKVGERVVEVCELPSPQLRLEPGQEAVEARPLTLTDDCSVEWEVGEPISRTNNEPGDGTSSSGASSDAGSGERASADNSTLAAATTHSGYFRVWWEDVVNITVNRLQSNLTWTTSGGSISSSTGGWSDYSRSGTGWARIQGVDSYIYRPNSSKHYVRSSAGYRNTVFCNGVYVYVYYDSVRMIGYGDGSMGGYEDDSWTTEIPSTNLCPNLHKHVGLYAN